VAVRTQTVSKASAAVVSATASTIQGSGLGAYVGYHIAITSGTGSGQVRYAINSAGRTDVLTVSEDWDIIPDTTSDVHVAWNQADYDSNFGNDFKLVLKATAEWDVGATGWTIGDGTNPVIGGLVDQALSMDDDLILLNRGFFAMGYRAGDTSLGGWYFNSNNGTSTLGYPHIKVQSGGTLWLGNMVCGTVFAHSVHAYTGSNVYIYDSSFTNVAYNGMRLEGKVYGTGMKVTGKGVTNDYVVVASGIVNYTGPITLANTYGFQSSAVSQTCRIRGYEAVAPQQDVEAHNSTTWEFVNPSWGTPQILWTQNDGNSTVSEIFEIVGDVKDTSGNALSSSKFIVVRSSTVANATIVVDAVTSTNGAFSDEILKRQWVSTNSSSTFGNFTGRAWNYGYVPFGGALDVTERIDLAVGMSLDSEIFQTTAASAVTGGAGITVENWASAGVNKLTALAYASGGAALVNDAIVSGAVSGAQGTVRETLGDTTSGTVALYDRNGVAFTNNEDLFVLGARKAQANVSSFSEDYTWEVIASAKSMQATYDYTAARMASTSATVEDWITQMRERNTTIIDAAAQTYDTEAYGSTGVWISKRGSGTINFMTADSGTQFIPAASYTFTLTGIQSDSEVRFYRTSDNALIDGIESSGTSFGYTYTYTGDVGIYAIVFHLLYKEVRLTGLTLSNANQSIPVQQQTDRVYRNP